MLLSLPPVVVALSDTMRPVILIVFIVGLFGLAGLAVLVGKRRVENQQSAALASDTGAEKGSHFGDDDSYSPGWLNETYNETDSTQRHKWQDLLLAPESASDEVDSDEQSSFGPGKRAARPAADENPFLVDPYLDED